MIPIPTRELQPTFATHAADFGIVGDRGPPSGDLPGAAIRDHLAAPAAVRIAGRYRVAMGVTHHYNPGAGSTR